MSAILQNMKSPGFQRISDIPADFLCLACTALKDWERNDLLYMGAGWQSSLKVLLSVLILLLKIKKLCLSPHKNIPLESWKNLNI